jgi:hypothetical protein
MKYSIYGIFLVQTHADGRGGNNYKYLIKLQEDAQFYCIPAKFRRNFQLIELSAGV